MKNIARTARLLAINSAALIAANAAASPVPSPTPTAVELAQQGKDLGWWMVEDLTTEIGPRQAATKAEAAARTWAVRRLNEMGFQNVREEKFTMPTWIRGDEQAALVGRVHAQKLALAALGNSASTGPCTPSTEGMISS